MEEKILTDKLRVFLKEAKDWAAYKTSAKEIQFLKIPETNNFKSRLLIRIKPVDSNGKFLKTKSLVLTREVYDQLKIVFTNYDLTKLFDICDNVNPEDIIKNNDMTLDISIDNLIKMEKPKIDPKDIISDIEDEHEEPLTDDQQLEKIR